MNDYFGALIRSSSLAVGAAGSPPDRGVRLQPDGDAPAISSDIVEIHEERTAPGVEPHPRALATEPLAAASIERVVPPARPRDVVTSVGNPSVIVPEAQAPRAVDARPRHEPAGEEPIPEPRRRDPDPVRLAMQWVATDPASRIIGAPPSIEHPAPRSESLRPQESVLFTEPPQVLTERVTVEASRRDRAKEPVRERVMPPAVLTHPTARVVSEQIERAAAAATVQLPHEEVVEISIGAINLHVEAPAPQTVVQAAPPAHSQPARDRAARSGLSRRYLRSF